MDGIVTSAVVYWHFCPYFSVSTCLYSLKCLLKDRNREKRVAPAFALDNRS